MANVPKVIHRSNLTVSTAPRVATVPAAKRWIVTNIVLTNYSTAPATVTVELDGILLVPASNLDAGAIFTLDCAQVVDTGKNVRLWASVGSVIAAHVSGVESDI